MRSRTNSIQKAPLLLAATLAALSGCAGPNSRTIVPTEPTRLGPVSGDREDVGRALLVALEAAEAAKLESAWAGDTFTASFLVVESREGQARAVDLGGGAFELWAFVQPRGDRDTQRVLLEAWARRLEQLEGVEWAPR